MTQPLNAILRSGGNIDEPEDIIKEMLMIPRDEWVSWLVQRQPGEDFNVSALLEMVREGERRLCQLGQLYMMFP